MTMTMMRPGLFSQREGPGSEPGNLTTTLPKEGHRRAVLAETPGTHGGQAHTLPHTWQRAARASHAVKRAAKQHTMTRPLFLLAALLSHAAVRALDGPPHGRSHRAATAQNSSGWAPWSGSICRRSDEDVVSLNFEDAILAHSNLGNLGGPATNQDSEKLVLNVPQFAAHAPHQSLKGRGAGRAS